MAADHPEYLPMYRALVEYARDVLGVCDVLGKLHFASPAAREVFGYAPQKLIGGSLIDWTHPDDRPRTRHWLDALGNRRGEPQGCTVRIGRPGRWRDLDLAGVLVMEDPDTPRIVFSGSDITERLLAAQAVRASEQKFRGAFDFAPIGKALMNPAGEFLEVNKFLATMLGCWVSELIGQGLGNFLDAGNAQALTNHLQEILSDPDQVRTMEVQLVAPHEREVWGWLNVAALTDAQNRVEFFILQIQDISDRHAAEAALRETNQELIRSNEELKRFAFIASHDLAEPLRGISGSIQLLSRRHAEALGDAGNELADQAVSGVKRMRVLLDKLIEYTEQMRGDEVESSPVQTQNVVQAVLEQLNDEVARSGAFADIGKLPTVLGDRDQIQQVFLQLIDNAIKFRHPDRPPRIRVSAAWDRRQWKIEVADNGIGIDPQYHEQIFEVFRTLHAGEEYEGTGVGLATAQKIVENHGGRIGVDSTPEGGSTFWFTLPPE